MPKFNDRTGEIGINSQNLNMKVITYRNASDIDVEFEDGFVAKNKNLTSFKRGLIYNPNYHRANTCDNRIGEIKCNSQGIQMEIIRYDNFNDISVLFEDGTIKNSDYKSFKRGCIKNENFTSSTLLVDRIGEYRTNNQGIGMKIIRYNGIKDIDVLFDDETIVKNKSYGHFKTGNISNPYYKVLYENGYLGDLARNPITKNSDVNVHAKWASMISRTFDEKHRKPNRQILSGNTVCEEWLCFSNFFNWWQENYYSLGDEEMNIDKDFLYKHNRTYSPDTCLIVPKRINSLITSSKKNRGVYPIGVYYSKNSNSYVAAMSKMKERVHIGCYNTPEKAFYAYKKEKESYIKQVADEYMKKYPHFPKKLYDAMYAYEVDITD